MGAGGSVQCGYMLFASSLCNDEGSSDHAHFASRGICGGPHADHVHGIPEVMMLVETSPTTQNIACPILEKLVGNERVSASKDDAA